MVFRARRALDDISLVDDPNWLMVVLLAPWSRCIAIVGDSRLRC